MATKAESELRQDVTHVQAEMKVMKAENQSALDRVLSAIERYQARNEALAEENKARIAEVDARNQARIAEIEARLADRISAQTGQIAAILAALFAALAVVIALLVFSAGNEDDKESEGSGLPPVTIHNHYPSVEPTALPRPPAPVQPPAPATAANP